MNIKSMLNELRSRKIHLKFESKIVDSINPKLPRAWKAFEPNGAIGKVLSKVWVMWVLVAWNAANGVMAVLNGYSLLAAFDGLLVGFLLGTMCWLAFCKAYRNLIEDYKDIVQKCFIQIGEQQELLKHTVSVKYDGEDKTHVC